MTVTQKEIINSALKCPLNEKSFNKHVTRIQNDIYTSGFKKIKEVSMGYSDRGMPIFSLDKKRRPLVIGKSHSFNAPTPGQSYGYIIEDKFNLKIQATIFEINRKLFLSSYSYHIELLDNPDKFFRYEKTEYMPDEDEDYKPEFHMHCMGRLPHYPAKLVTVGQLLRNLKANIFNPENTNRLDPPWGKLFN